MPTSPPSTPFILRNTLIQKGISTRELARKADVSLATIAAACKDDIICYSGQMKITWTLQKHYGIAYRRKDLFFTNSS